MIVISCFLSIVFSFSFKIVLGCCYLLCVIGFLSRLLEVRVFYINYRKKYSKQLCYFENSSMKTMVRGNLNNVHLLCWTKFTAMFVGTNCEGPSFFLCLSQSNFNLASSVASILRIFALKQKFEIRCILSTVYEKNEVCRETYSIPRSTSGIPDNI